MVLQVIDLVGYLNKSNISVNDKLDPELKKLCFAVSQSLRDTGALLIRDPRCSSSHGDNNKLLDMMEKYWEMPESFKRLQERPLLGYQVGVTPEGTENPRVLVDEEMQDKVRQLPNESQPLMPTGADLKWRYMWRVGPRPANTRFQELYAEPVIPDGFPEWENVMDSWGYKMLDAVEVVAEMAAIGFGLPRNGFVSLMNQAPHQLAPTGNNLEEYGEEGTVFAGYHYDLNFLSIHGKARFPGLNIWLKSGQKLQVDVPDGCLLVQSGKQMEYLTGGECMAGMHEVVVTKSTCEAIKIAKHQNRSLWRVSSTLFAHVASDAVLKPLGHFSETPSAYKYPPILVGDFMRDEVAFTKGDRSDNGIIYGY